MPSSRSSVRAADRGSGPPSCMRTKDTASHLSAGVAQGHIQPRIARRGIESSARLGRHRWVVERTLSWLNRYRRLKVRYERRAEIHQAFLSLGCALICWGFLQQGFC